MVNYSKIAGMAQKKPKPKKAPFINCFGIDMSKDD